jgi:hypothetical protein
MSSSTDYRNHAEVCLRMADAVLDERDRPLWIAMAQSWLRLAEQAERINLELVAEHSADTEDTETGHLRVEN